MIGLGKRLWAPAIVVLALTLGGPGVSAEPDYDETKLQAFVSAMIAADSAGRRWRMVILSAESESLADSYRAQAAADMTTAIQNTEGITLDEYRTIAEAVRSDGELATRLADMYMARVPQ